MLAKVSDEWKSVQPLRYTGVSKLSCSAFQIGLRVIIQTLACILYLWQLLQIVFRIGYTQTLSIII